MATIKPIFREEYSKYISREMWQKECLNLKDGDNKVLYFNPKEKVRLRISKIGKKVYTVKTTFGDMDIRECVRNMIVKQA
ncbi:MAG: hypothetical protein ACRCWG_16155 [Sarcina sp.]